MPIICMNTTQQCLTLCAIHHSHAYNLLPSTLHNAKHKNHWGNTEMYCMVKIQVFRLCRYENCFACPKHSAIIHGLVSMCVILG